MMATPDFICAADVLDFPPCHSLALIEFSEHMMFAFLPGLPRFVRAITTPERAAGFGDGCDAGLGDQGVPGRIERTYGNSIFP